MPLASGLAITASIRLNRLLKQGGMGSVWVADHLTLNTQVAVKFMSPELVESPPAIARFTREATAAAQIKSPHIVQILDHGLTPDRVPFIVMELLEGEELGKRLKRTGPLGLRDTSKILLEAARALGRAHQLGIVHRDIKPDNLFLLDVDGEPFVKVLDFGIAKQVGDDGSKFGLTSTGSMVGTPYYMSPEQLLSAKNVDFRSDLWSLGIVAYRMLTGRVPFRGETLGSLCVAIERGQFDRPSSHRRDIPPAVDTWFLRALARDPKKRFDTAKEMAEAFVAATVGAKELAPMAAVLTQDSFTPSPSSDADATPASYGATPAFDAAHSNPGAAWAPPSSAGTFTPIHDDESTGPSVHPTFSGATRTSPGTGGSPRRPWIAIGVGAASVLILGGIAAVVWSGHGRAPADGSSAAQPAASPSSVAVTPSNSASASASATATATSAPVATATPAASSAETSAPAPSPPAAEVRHAPRNAPLPAPRATPTHTKPASPPPGAAEPKERDRGF